MLLDDKRSTEISTLSLHDALPISNPADLEEDRCRAPQPTEADGWGARQDRKSTRLNSSHTVNSYAVFRLKKKRLMSHLVPDDLKSAAYELRDLMATYKTSEDLINI